MFLYPCPLCENKVEVKNEYQIACTNSDGCDFAMMIPTNDSNQSISEKWNTKRLFQQWDTSRLCFAYYSLAEFEKLGNITISEILERTGLDVSEVKTKLNAKMAERLFFLNVIEKHGGE